MIRKSHLVALAFSLMATPVLSKDENLAVKAERLKKALSESEEVGAYEENGKYLKAYKSKDLAVETDKYSARLVGYGRSIPGQFFYFKIGSIWWERALVLGYDYSFGPVPEARFDEKGLWEAFEDSDKGLLLELNSNALTGRMAGVIFLKSRMLFLFGMSKEAQIEMEVLDASRQVLGKAHFVRDGKNMTITRSEVFSELEGTRLLPTQFQLGEIWTFRKGNAKNVGHEESVEINFVPGGLPFVKGLTLYNYDSENASLGAVRTESFDAKIWPAGKSRFEGHIDLQVGNPLIFLQLKSANQKLKVQSDNWKPGLEVFSSEHKMYTRVR